MYNSSGMIPNGFEFVGGVDGNCTHVQSYLQKIIYKLSLIDFRG